MRCRGGLLAPSQLVFASQLVLPRIGVGKSEGPTASSAASPDGKALGFGGCVGSGVLRHPGETNYGSQQQIAHSSRTQQSRFLSNLAARRAAPLLARALAMGLLSACFGKGTVMPTPPAASSTAANGDSRLESKMARQTQLVEHGPMLVSLLSSGQQEELASAFQQFDLDKSGAMYGPPRPAPRASIPRSSPRARDGRRGAAHPLTAPSAVGPRRPSRAAETAGS